MAWIQFSRRVDRRAGFALVACSLCLLLAMALAPRARAAAPVGTFQTLAASPEPMTAVTVDPTTNMIYAQGFADTMFYRYDPSANTWTQLADAPIVAGNDGGSAYLNGKVYTLYPTDPADMGVYDIATNTWTALNNPVGSGTADITAAGSLLYVASGTTLVSYDPATDTTTTLADAPGFAANNTCAAGDGFEAWGALVPDSGKIYGDQGNGCNGMAVYDVASNSWTTLSASLTGAVLGGAIDPVSGTYYDYGSYGASSWMSYDIGSNSWSTQPFPAPPLDDGGMAYVSTPGLQGIYAVQGERGDGFVRFVTPSPSADLSLTKTASVSSTTVGDQFTYTLTVHNGGPQDSTGTAVSDPLPSQVTLVSATASQGSCSGTTTVSCGLGTVPNGASATVTITVRAVTAGTANNTAAVTGDLTDANPANNSASASVTIKPAILPPPPPPSPPKILSLSVSPTIVLVHAHRCFAFRATSSGKAVGGVTVKFAGKKAHTSSKGRARLCVTLKHRGTDRASATKKGYVTAHASVHVKPRPKKKPVHFTG
jgi:uncharacterized repeat protein (TIGR01451 family)